MKPFLGIDLTTNKDNEQVNGEEFLIQRPSPALTALLDESTEKAEEAVERSKLPLPLRIIEYICGIAALLIASGIFKADVSFAEGYKNAPALYWAAAICAVVWLILWIWSKLKSNATLETDETTQTMSRLEGVSNSIYTDLDVPANAKDADVLFFFYKLKDGQIKVQEKSLIQYLNPEFKVYADSDYLYLANLEAKYAFSLSEIKAIRTVQKRIRILSWNKEEAHNKGIYKKYKLTSDDSGCIHCKYYHIIELEHDGQLHGIYIPCYELPVFEELIGLKMPIEPSRE